MSDSTPETDAGTAFAAGLATAEAEQARIDAANAQIEAEVAAERAGAAELTAGAAIEHSWATKEAFEAHAAQVRGELDAIRELISTAEGGTGDGRKNAGEGAASDAGAVPAPERKEDETPAPVVEDTGTPKRRSYGSKTWFGDR